MRKSIPEWFSKNKLNLIVLFVSLIVVFAFLELINYFFFIDSSYSYVWPPNINRIFLPASAVFHGIQGVSYFTINELGYRGPLIANKEKEYRILFVGGSTTEGLYLDDKETWPYLLAQNLNLANDGRKVISINIGKSGHNTRDHILQLKYLTGIYEPDIIVLMVGANDMLLKLSKRWVWKPFNEDSYDYTKAFASTQKYTFRSTFVYKIFKIFYTKFYLNLEPQDTIGENLIESRLERKNAEITIKESPDLNLVLEDYEKNLNRLIEISREHNVTILFVTQPYLWKSNMTEEEDSVLWMTTDFNGNFYSTDVMMQSMDKFNSKMLEVCSKNQDVLCLDLEKKIPKSLEFFYDDLHFNEKGAQIVAEELAGFIKNKYF